MADDGEFDPSEEYLYRGGWSVPRNVRRVEVCLSVKSIPDRLFQDCRQLESVLLHDGLLKIGRKSFYGCTSLRTIQIPSTVTQIGDGAFRDCSNLATIALPEGLKSIESWTFCDCTSLEEVRIPSSVARIGGHAFWDCTNLSSIELREGLRIIGFSTFASCQSLESLCVPSSVDEIGKLAFYGCSSLELVQMHKDLPKMKRNSFMLCPLESFQFAGLSDRMEAIRMDDETKSMFESRLREIKLALTGEDRDDEDGDNSDDAEAIREKCKESLARAHEVLTYLELKGASPVLELALWKTKIEGEREERGQGGLVRDEVRGQDLSDVARERKILKVNKDIDRNPRLSRTDCRVKCGAGIVSSEVLKFFAFSATWPQMDD